MHDSLNVTKFRRNWSIVDGMTCYVLKNLPWFSSLLSSTARNLSNDSHVINLYYSFLRMGSRDLSNLENNFNLKFVKYTDRNKPSCRKISLTLHYLQTSTVIYFHLFRSKNNSFTVFSSIYKKRRKKKKKHLAIIQSEKKNRREGGRGKKKENINMSVSEPWWRCCWRRASTWTPGRPRGPRCTRRRSAGRWRWCGHSWTEGSTWASGTRDRTRCSIFWDSSRRTSLRTSPRL